jgi:hypothetical protein
MNETDILKKLGAAARRADVPDVDLTTLRLPTPETDNEITDRPLMWIAACSTAAAAGVWIFAAQAWSQWTDPLTGIFYAIRWSMS